MKLIRDEQAYADVIGDFVRRSTVAQEFLPRFSHLWGCDVGEDALKTMAAVPMTCAESGLYGLLDSINDLCEAYWRSLPPGCGYRVSEEQFRKQVQTMASTNRILDAGTH